MNLVELSESFKGRQLKNKRGVIIHTKVSLLHAAMLLTSAAEVALERAPIRVDPMHTDLVRRIKAGQILEFTLEQVWWLHEKANRILAAKHLTAEQRVAKAKARERMSRVR